MSAWMKMTENERKVSEGVCTMNGDEVVIWLEPFPEAQEAVFQGHRHEQN